MTKHRHGSRSDRSTLTPDELREQVAGTREKLGRTVDALAAKADIRTQAQEKAAKVRSQVQGKAAHVLHAAQDKTPQPVREKAAHAKEQVTGTAHVLGQKIEDRTPQPVRERAYQAAEGTRADRAVLLLAGLAVLAAVIIIVRRGRKT
ncbi:DUF3618 domain-containing protein [Streptomyces spiramyceticus]|uniref:DUF3618 domain-containing protein n=1 Tax=Streptomyces spiramyceticus TaxID=299717 RepID=UPI00237BF0A1|nr:DUF3618 domain-containing protein [Streptomyces spiramyceticus]